MSKAFQQGQADGLCGIYAILNFLVRAEPDWKLETPQNTLWYLLDACRHSGWLTPQHLTEGFEEWQLKAILDLQIANYRMSYITHYVSDVAEALGTSNFGKIADKVLEKGGAVIAHHGKRNHWLLIDGADGEAKIIDSESAAGPIALNARQRSIGTDFGLIILKADRKKVEIDL